MLTGQKRLPSEFPVLFAHPAAFEAVTGVPPDAFDAAVGRLERDFMAERVRRHGDVQQVRRAGGRPHSLTPAERVLVVVLKARFGPVAVWPLALLLWVSEYTVRRAVRALAAAVRSDPELGVACRLLSPDERRERLGAACRSLPLSGGRLRHLAVRCGVAFQRDGSLAGAGEPGAGANPAARREKPGSAT